ncbi:GvpL/GvpF family gas vesicle protein [Streptomyces xinghaiensis]|uniref:GvpL/GvpF family gas vesicle protein n=1 Tax=Streptomyces xinghaiensis TaxID=1038928 RepID=UPI002E0F8202|nr:GvpL/GvpF family gas vesicle protein [Streptomyces xinghaiensis]
MTAIPSPSATAPAGGTPETRVVPAGAPAAPPASAGSTLTCVFVVCRGGDPAPALATTPGHRGGGPLRALPVGALTAVVQDVPAAAFSEEALRKRLSDPGELELCARAHHAVVAAVADHASAIPFPLATLYREDGRVRAALRSKEPRLHAVFDRIAGRVEWGVKVCAAPLPAAPETAPRTAAARDTGTTAETGTAPDRGTPAPGTGRAYLARVRGRHRAREERQNAALRAAEQVDAALRGISAAARRLRVHDARPAGDPRTHLLNAAYLIDRDRDETVAATLRRLRADPGTAGVHIEVTGPWVPYSFAATGDGDDDG